MRPSKEQQQQQKKPSLKSGVVAQTFNPSTQEEDPGQLGLYSEILPQNKTTKKSPQKQNYKTSKQLQQTSKKQNPTDSQEGEQKEAVEIAYTTSHSPFYKKGN